MEIKINIEKRHFFVILVSMLILVGALAVYAFNPSGISGIPSTMGHSVDEIDWSKPIQDPVTMNGRLDVKGRASFQGNNLFIKNPNSPENTQTWGFVVSGSNGKFNIGQAADTIPSGGSLASTHIAILPGGNVGIGTQNPSAKLEVSGDVKVGGKLNLAGAIDVYKCPTHGPIAGRCVSGCNGQLVTVSTQTCSYPTGYNYEVGACIISSALCNTLVGKLIPN